MFLKSRFPLQDCFQLPFFRKTRAGIPVFQIYAGKKRRNKSRYASGNGVDGALIHIGDVRPGTRKILL